MSIALLPLSPFSLAHGGVSHAADAWWSRWNWDPLILGSLLLLSLFYGVGLLRLWRSAGASHGASRWAAFSFFAAMVSLVIALISPIDVASDELQSAHMIQHMLIMMVAAPLFVLGAPALVMLWALPPQARQTVGKHLTLRPSSMLHPLSSLFAKPRYLLWQPILLCILFGLTLWVWHLPALYSAALHSRPVHEVQHISFFVASALFWRVLLDPLSRLRMHWVAGVFYLFLTSLHATLLGVFMTLSPSVWYAEYVPTAETWNLSALEDQQLAGLIMWMPACMVYAFIAAVILARGVEKDGGAPLAAQ